MKTTKYESESEWLEARRGKITGSRLADIVVKRGTGYKIGFYELIAEKIAEAADGENPMDRGHRLEDEALDRFTKETKKKLDKSLVIWSRDDDENIAISPDASVLKEKAAVEVKCLSSAKHIKAWLTKEVPEDYQMQVIQYFIVNEKLKKLYFVFYDPRMPVKDFFYFELKREKYAQDIEDYLAYERDIMERVNEIVNDLTF